MRNVYSVKQVNSYIKNMFTQDFMLNRIYVKGEVSNCKYHTSGHIYFSLKDESGTLACIMFAGQRAGLTFRMQEGQQVIVLGNITTYERDGKYQLYAREIILDGAGLLYAKFEALKKELKKWVCLLRNINSRFLLCKADWYCNCTYRGGDSGYYKYLSEKKSLCAVDFISGACTGEGRTGKHYKRYKNVGRKTGRFDYCRQRRRFY